METCKICGGSQSHIIYNGVIRNGGLGQYTRNPVPMYQCNECGAIWHDVIVDNIEEYYESSEYRDAMGEGSGEEAFYRHHDKETFDKFRYTGTDIFRNKIVADIGCGAGAFLDFLKGVTTKIIAIEPSEPFQRILERKGFCTYAYAKDAIQNWNGQVNVITSFDVIEHIEDPISFVQDAYTLLQNNGTAIIGTPTDAPIMRSLLGECYEKKVLFSVQHLWIFSGESLRLLAQKAGFRHIEIHYYQRYGIENVLGWCLEKEPKSTVDIPFFRHEIDAVWRGTCSGHHLADYVVLYATK